MNANILRTCSANGLPSRSARLLFLGMLLMACGCAAVANPIADGIPVKQLPDEFRGKSRETLKQIPLTYLRQQPINDHKVGPGDILGIGIENVLGEPKQALPVTTNSQTGQPPSLGFPIVVQDDGTIALPYVDPIKVEGMTLIEDVLNALTRSGGLPGTDAKNEVIIYKKNPRKGSTDSIIRIPLRIKPGEKAPFAPEDILLDNGDIVALESRDAEVFYTAGLIGSAQYPLPRDYDLDIVQAIAQVRGTLLQGGFGQAQFVANVLSPGLGGPSPSLVSVLRKTASGKQLTIRIDLNKAFKDPRERILVQPGDIIVMQEKPGESVARYLYQTFRYTFVGRILQGNDATVDVNGIFP
ncbi:MAG: polysaccharide biosynthesis/export family protein [Planctomycetes bacterium]|nr:polysaccharide biosynthesis/export family protein [Planctomycetota bacterium]